MDIIIVGCGKVGSVLAEELNNAGHNITVVDKQEASVKALAQKLDIMGVSGNGVMTETLNAAGLEHAELLIACTGSDETNMLCSLIAKKQAKIRVIARIRNPEYEKEIRYLQEEFDISMVINPERNVAREIVHLLRFPSAIEIDSFAGGRVEMIKMKLPEVSPIANSALKDLSRKISTNPLICVIERGEETIIPSGDVILRPGDLISFIVRSEDAAKFCRECALQYEPNKSAIIVGGGIITYYIAQQLKNAKSKCGIKVIEKVQQRCDDLAARFPELTVIHGDALNQQLLLEEGISGAEAFVSVTGFDEQNLILNMMAEKMSKARLIAKVDRLNPDILLGNLPIGSVINAQKTTADIVSRFVRALEHSKDSNMERLYTIANGKAVACEFVILKDEAFTNIPLSKLEFKKNVVVGAIIRERSVIFPGGSDYFLENDHVIIITTDKKIRAFSDLLA